MTAVDQTLMEPRPLVDLPGVFSGDWWLRDPDRDEVIAWENDEDDQSEEPASRYVYAFRGRMVRAWGGGVEFRTDAPAVQRLCELREAEIEREVDRVFADHPDRAEARRIVNGFLTQLHWRDGKLHVIPKLEDEEDPYDVEPDADGLFTVGFGWRWEMAPLEHCDEVFGG